MRAARTTPGGSLSIWMRTGMRWARRTQDPYDADGRRRGYEEIPGSVRDLVDDPFRSMVGELCRAGGFAKETTPFSEFLWTDLLRRRITLKAVQSDFTHAMEKALDLAKSVDANYLPGWCAPIPGG